MAVATGALRGGRYRAKRRMTERATITRPTGAKPVTDPATGKVTTPMDTIVEDYPCRLRSHEPFETRAEIGGRTVIVERTALRVAASAAYVPREGDVVQITASAFDPSIVTDPPRIFRVANIPQHTGPTQFRVPVDEVRS